MRTKKALKNGFLFCLIGAIYFFLNALPLGWARNLGAGLGRLFFVLVAYERKKTLRQLELAFPGRQAGERRKIGSDVFAHLGRGGAEFMRFPRLSMEDLLPWISKVEGIESWEALNKSGRGIVAVTAHIGHWELLAAYTGMRMRVAVVARQLYDNRLNQKLNEFRRGKNLLVFERNTSVKPILRWLKEGGVLGVLCDQDTGVDSVFVDFFGREAKTPSGAAWLASTTGAALMTAFSLREADGRYRLSYDPRELSVAGKGASKQELRPAVQEYTRRTEEFIRQDPGQWAWNHNRWRSKKEEASPGWDPSESA
jgi:KDO2-lipid IV(A) lauroyltransferase